MIIYCTTNLINGKKYIGKDQNNDPKYLGSGTIFRRALKKHGASNFKKEILQHCSSLEELSKAEIYWISHFSAAQSNTFYNISTGGTGGDNRTFHPEKKRLFKEASIRQKQMFIDDPGKRERLSHAKKIFFINNPEKRKEKSDFMKKYSADNYSNIIERAAKRKQTLLNNPEIEIKRVAKIKKFFKENPEVIKKIIEKRNKTLSDPEVKKRYIISHSGHKRTRESINKSIETKKLNRVKFPFKIKPRSEEYCKKLSKALKGKPAWNKGKKNYLTEEQRKNMREKAAIRVKNRPLITCPHCNYSGYNKGSIIRVHFDKCKLLKNGN